MPRCHTDANLLAQVQALVDGEGGNIASAARMLGLSRLAVWRFLKSGKALPRTRALIEGALPAHLTGNETLANLETKRVEGSDREVAAVVPGAFKDDLMLLRRVCEAVIVLIDAHAPTATHGLAAVRQSGLSRSTCDREE